MKYFSRWFLVSLTGMLFYSGFVPSSSLLVSRSYVYLLCWVLHQQWLLQEASSCSRGSLTVVIVNPGQAVWTAACVCQCGGWIHLLLRVFTPFAYFPVTCRPDTHAAEVEAAALICPSHPPSDSTFAVGWWDPTNLPRLSSHLVVDFINQKSGGRGLGW